MKKLIFSMHTSLDGYVANAEGAMSWININDEIFDFVDTFTAQADYALYGRNTFNIMQSYWPTAADKENASKHEKVHSHWFKEVNKMVLSKSMQQHEFENINVINEKLSENINQIKKQGGKNILIFGSPGAIQSLLNEGLVDEFWLFVNPVILGSGHRLFKDGMASLKLNLMASKTFKCGVIALHYAIVK